MFEVGFAWVRAQLSWVATPRSPSSVPSSDFQTVFDEAGVELLPRVLKEFARQHGSELMLVYRIQLLRQAPVRHHITCCWLSSPVLVQAQMFIMKGRCCLKKECRFDACGSNFKRQVCC